MIADLSPEKFVMIFVFSFVFCFYIFLIDINGKGLASETPTNCGTVTGSGNRKFAGVDLLSDEIVSEQLTRY